MQSVRAITNTILRHEGGFVDDPDDPGGATNFGITIHTLRRLERDLTGDGAVDRADIRALTRDLAAQIMEEQYFQKMRIGLLPAPLQATVYDMAVNAGGQGIVILQRVLRDFGEDLALDGIIGPKTAAAAHRALTRAPDHLVDAYGIARRNYYYRLGDLRPPLRKFARARDGSKGGWILRAESFVSARYHLTLAQHRERVSAWA